MKDHQKTERKISRFFDGASSDMVDQHEEKLPQSMREQIDILIEDGSTPVLDVGSGPGTLLRELLKNGIKPVIGLDLSPAMNNTAKQQLIEEGLDEFEILDGSFLTTPIETKPEAISLHRVLCCHPDREGMLQKSAEYKPKLITITVPRDWKILRFLIFFYRGIAKIVGWFEVFIHTQKSIDQKMQKLGYEIYRRHKETWWITTGYKLMSKD